MSEDKIAWKTIKEDNATKAMNAAQPPSGSFRIPSNSWTSTISSLSEKELERHTTPPIEIRRPNSKRILLNREERSVLKIWRHQCPQTAFLCSFHEKLAELRRFSFSATATTLNESVKRFVITYMRNWEANYEQVFKHCLKREKKAVEEFKVQHPKLTRDEWNWLTNKMKKNIDIDAVSDNAKEILFNFMTISSSGTITPSCSFSSSSGSECSGLLHKALMEYSESDDSESCEKKEADSEFSNELIFNYFCIYFPNYTELWCSEVHILTKKLRVLISEFLTKYPVIKREILDTFLSAVDKFTTTTCNEDSSDEN